MLFFDPEDGGNIFLRNIGSLSMDYISLLSAYTSVPKQSLDKWIRLASLPSTMGLEAGCSSETSVN
jgi:hypothetical protein